MTKSLGKLLGVATFALLVGTCGAQIVRNAVAEPVTTPLEPDRQNAMRDAKSTVPGRDERDALSPGASWVGANGVVEPIGRETRLAAQVTAVVTKVRVSDGQAVKAGDLLVQLDDGAERAALAAAEAEVLAEKSTLSRLLKGSRGEDKEAVGQEAAAAQSRAELSASIAGRTEQLAKSGAATADELERARRQAQTDRATWLALDARSRAAVAGSRGEDIAVQRARVAGAEARAQQALAAAERLAVRAPHDGEVLQVNVKAGELYTFQGTEPLVVIGDTRALRVRMEVDERDVGRVKVGAAAWAQADAFGERRFEGRVLELARRFGRKTVKSDSPTEKNDTRVLEVLLELDAPGPLIPGQRVVAFVKP
ncbi:MAG: HlyD family efflux transporter periplasmic adaptor subunit [Myxococcaceae bacterium]|nr:HlyD family efflux transporter periplasmic adaptor subunit [Myxococcaceae bacterium]